MSRDILTLKNTSDLANIANYLNTPLATYTHTSNVEIVVSAVDVATDTFTSVDHSLVNGNKVYPIMNYNAGNIYPIDKYPGGITFAAGYFVINKTADTYQLSLTNGGVAIDITTNANLDLTKWHFEKWIADPSITGLPTLTKCKVTVRGRLLNKNAGCNFTVTGMPVDMDFLGGSTYNYMGMTAGDISIDYDITINYNKIFTVKLYGNAVQSNTNIANTSSFKNVFFVAPKYRDRTFNSVSFTNCFFANGTIVEVYKV
jgi:hypothetical protein